MMTPERIAELRSMLNRFPHKIDLNTMWDAAYGLLDEIDRLRAVIRETCDPRSCGGGMHSHTCKLYEIEP
jgi:hypothetical protein